MGPGPRTPPGIATTAHPVALEAARAFAGGLEEEQDVAGVFLTGSAALGGFLDGRSDVDLVAVVRSPLGHRAKHAVVTAARGVGWPGRGLDLAVIRADVAGAPALPVPIELGLEGVPPFEVTDGADVDDWPNLLIVLEMTRRSGLAITGPTPGRLLGAVPRETVIARCVADLRGPWPSSPEYRVLNACRSLRFAVEGAFSSKLDGGAWALERLPSADVVRRAMDRHRGADVPLEHADAEAFVDRVLAMIRGDQQARSADT